MSHAAWQAMAAGWDGRSVYLERTARPVTDRLLERLAPAPGQTILDLAAGTGLAGFSATALVGSSGRVIVSDFAEAMVDAAARRARELGLENVDCRVLDAQRLDLPDSSVDGVLCRWGYMLMPDPAAALRETRRVLRSRGRLACAVFAGPEENPWAALPMQVLQQRGHLPATAPDAPGILALADRNRLARLLAAAHFTDTGIDEVPFTWSFTGIDDYWDFLSQAAGAIAMVLQRLPGDERERTRTELANRLGSAGEQIELPAVSLVVSAS